MADTNHRVSGHNHHDRSDAVDEYLDQYMEDRINSGYGSILDQLEAEAQWADEYPDLDLDEPWDEILAQQELEDFEQADEYFGYYGGEDGW